MVRHLYDGPQHEDVTVDANEPDSVIAGDDGGDPEREALLADSVGVALLVVLDRLAPAERLAFVLHDIFAVPFDQIGRSWGAARRRHASLRAAPATGSRHRATLPTPNAPSNARSCARSSQPRATVISRRSWNCSTRTL